jgi:outer membrane protein assembly factor BamD (BamD/ComL family)
MKKLILIVLALIIVGGACQGPEKQSTEKQEEVTAEERIAALEEELFNAASMRIDRKKALELIRLYEQYAREYPDDPKAPEYLFKAADISMNMRRPKATIVMFDKIIEEFPGYEKSSSALFLKAFVYEDQLQDYENARKYYEQFLSEYPDSEFADDAEVSLKNLGKSPEELIKEFEQNTSE